MFQDAICASRRCRPSTHLSLKELLLQRSMSRLMLSGVVPNSLNTHSGSLSQCVLHFLLKVRGEPGTFKSLGILMETTLEVKQEKESTGCYAIGYIPAPPPPIEACAFGKKNYRSDSHPDIKFPSITTAGGARAFAASCRV